MPVTPLPTRVTSRLAPEEGHLLWTGSQDRRGYPVVMVDGHIVSLARMVWMAEGHPLEEDEILIGDCGYKFCVAPAHHHAEKKKGARQRTHCKRGHPLTGANVYLGPDLRKRCQVCKRERTYESMARRLVQLRERVAELEKTATEMSKALDKKKAWTPAARKAALAAGITEEGRST